MTAQTITAEELDKFTTRNRREILFYLRQLINDGERISVIFDEGSETVLTVLLAIDEGEGLLIFDWGGSEAANRKLLKSERNFFVCAPHGVKNQFLCGHIYESVYKRRPAFATHIPDRYTRLQRREFFRLELPLTRRPVCTIPREGASPTLMSVADISVGGIGGVAIDLSDSKPDFAIGQVLPRARIDIKGIGTLDVDLEVRNCVDIQRGGKTTWRVGCRFIDLNHAIENKLQRFITDVQREERVRLGG